MRWLFLILCYLLIDLYAFQAVKTLASNKIWHYLYIALSILVMANLIYQSRTAEHGISSSGMRYAIGFFLVSISPKLVLIVFMLGEDIGRIFYFVYQKLSYTQAVSFPGRRKALSMIALGIAAIPFGALLYGMYRGRYQYRVLSYELEFEDLPDAFDGFKLTQISDIHSGSLDNHEKVSYGIELINQQNSDVILFTGDIVNNEASELAQWQSLFGSLQAKEGVYSILGNHDYGDYVPWASQDDKIKNLSDLKKMQANMGWDLLLNEHRAITRGDDRIYLVGVENWGSGRFVKKGDINKAAEGLGKEDFKVLLSHDPSYWDEEIHRHDKHFQLTLSGHTHGMQFGIEIPGWVKWSPVQYRYKRWAGIYEEMGRYINVNRGFGYLAYPGRVGVWPEVSVITLKKKRTA